MRTRKYDLQMGNIKTNLVSDVQRAMESCMIEITLIKKTEHDQYGLKNRPKLDIM